MTSQVPHKLSNIQTLRGIAALLVVISHLPVMEIKHGGDSFLPAFFRLGISGVDLFFVISGFIMVYVTQNENRGIKTSLKFLFARVTRIYPIYWLIAGAVFIMWWANPNLVNVDPDKTNFIKSFFLWPDQTLPMLKVAWTLIHELYFYIIFVFILLLPRRWLIPSLILWSIAVTGGHLMTLGTTSPELLLIFNPLSLEFFLGALAGFLFIHSRGARGRSTLFIGAIFYISAIAYFGYTLSKLEYPNNWERVLFFGVPAMLVVYGLAALDLNRVHLAKWSSALGDWSYSLYLSHILTLSVIGYIWRKFTITGPLDNIAMAILMPLSSIFVAACLWFLFEKPTLTFFRKIRSNLFG